MVIDEEYTKLETVEVGSINGVAAGSSGVAVSSGSNVAIVAGTDRYEIDHDETVVDVALSDRVVVLSEAGLTAYSLQGDQLWTRNEVTGHAIAAMPDGDLVGLLDPDRLYGIDGETGDERFVFDRTRSGSRPDDTLIATPGGFVTATWSFLTAVSAAGVLTFDRNLDAVVQSIGRFDDGFVAVLQNGRTVCLDEGTGDIRWQTDLQAKHVAPIGETVLLADTGDGVRAVRTDGVTEPVSELPSGTLYTSPDGSVVCVSRSGTVTTYVQQSDSLEIDILTESVGPGEAIDIAVTNLADATFETALGADVDGAELSPAVRSIRLDPEETDQVEFPVASTQRTLQTEIELTVDGVATERAPLALEDQSGDPIAVDAELTVTRVEGGTATLEITVENVGAAPIDAARVLETDDSITPVEPGEWWTETITRPYEPDQRVSIGIEAVRGDRRREVASTCALPSLPTVDAEVIGDAIRLDLGIDGTIPVSDRLVVSVPGAGRARLPVEIDDDGLQLVIPTFDEGAVRVGFEELEFTESVSPTVAEPAPVIEPTDGGEPTEDASRPERRSMDGEQWWETTADAERGAVTEGKRDATTEGERATATEANREGSAPDVRSSLDDRRSDEHSISVSRSRVNAPRPIGHAVRERLEITNDGETSTEIRIASTEDTTVSLDSGERATLSRSLAALDPSGAVVPATTVESSDGPLEEFPETGLERCDGVAVRTAVDPDEGTVVAEFENETESHRYVKRLRVLDVERSLDISLKPGETSVVTDQLDLRSSPPGDVIEASVTTSTDTDVEQTEAVLAAVTRLHSGSPASESERPLQGHISTDTRVTEGYGTVVLVFENERDRPLDAVSIAASGEPINELFYSETHRERVAPGERIEHFVDLNGATNEAGFDVTVTYTAGGEKRRYALRVTGPVAPEEGAWCDDHLSGWSLEPLGWETARTFESIPSLLATPYRREENRSASSPE